MRWSQMHRRRRRRPASAATCPPRPTAARAARPPSMVSTRPGPRQRLQRRAKGTGGLDRRIGKAAGQGIGRFIASSPRTSVKNSTFVAAARAARACPPRVPPRRAKGSSTPRLQLRRRAAPASAHRPAPPAGHGPGRGPAHGAWPTSPDASRTEQRVTVISPRLNGAPDCHRSAPAPSPRRLSAGAKQLMGRQVVGHQLCKPGCRARGPEGPSSTCRSDLFRSGAISDILQPCRFILYN